MGLAVLPSRLVDEVDAIVKALLLMKKANPQMVAIDKDLLTSDSSVLKHFDWVMTLETELISILNGTENFESALRTYFKNQIGTKFEQVLEDAGIYKSDYQRMQLFLDTVDSEGMHAS